MKDFVKAKSKKDNGYPFFKNKLCSHKGYFSRTNDVGITIVIMKPQRFCYEQKMIATSTLKQKLLQNNNQVLKSSNAKVLALGQKCS
jgi:hypothetical protein